MWKGSGANKREIISAEESIEAIAEGSVKIVNVDEGKESEKFWCVYTIYKNFH